MLGLIAFSAVLMQVPPAPPTPPEVRTRVMVVGPQGAGALDKDGDGYVSREEFAAPMNDHFARIDKDGDGRLSPEELSAGHAGGNDLMVFRSGAGGEAGREEREIVVRGATGRGTPLMIHGVGRGGPDRDTRVEIVRMGGPGSPADLDKDGDGRISEDEFVAPLRDAFARLDADGSGFIEEGEGGRDGALRVFTHRIEPRDAD
jgi:hypothetical protein